MRTITVKGVGNLSVKPNYITLSMTIEEIAPDYSRAMKAAAKRIALIQNAAVQNGFQKEDVKTASFHVDTRYESVKDCQGNYKQEFVGYACVYRLKFSFDFDTKHLSAVISSIAECDAKPELSIAFTVKDPMAVHEDLLVAAAENAKSKAEILCRASGYTLGELAKIDYNFDELNLLSRTNCDAESSFMAMSRCAMPEIEPENIEVSDSVSFTWEIQ